MGDEKISAKEMTFNLVQVVWKDHVSIKGDPMPIRDIGKEIELTVIESYGLLVRETDESIVIAMSIVREREEVMDQLCIQKSSIIKSTKMATV